MPNAHRQAAVLAVKDGLVCVVTSRDGARWVIPKGHIDAGHTAAEAAAREAYEEAGLEGDIDEPSLGQYTYEKNGRRYKVSVFLMTVTIEHESWPESDRQKQWVPLEEAARRMKEKELRELLQTVPAMTELESRL